MAVVPLYDRGKPVGVLKIYSDETDSFSDRDLLAAQLITGPLANGFAAATEAQALKTSRQANQRFLATFHQAAVGIAHVRLDGHFMLVNQRFCEIAGRSSRWLIGRTFQEITHPEDVETDLGYLQAMIDGKIPYYSADHVTLGLTWIRRSRSR